MYLRKATARDLHQLTNITVTSLKDDPAFDFMWRYRHRYPEDNFFFWQQTLQTWLYDKKNTFIVMVLDSTDKGPDSKLEILPDQIVSYAVWVREGRSKAALERWAAKNTWSNMVDAVTTSVQVWSTARKYQRRDADFARLQALGAMVGDVEETFWEHLPERWLLQLMVTDVNFRRRGAATALLKWGMEQADEERLVCKVEASPLGRLLYKSQGFVDLGPFVVAAAGQEEFVEIWAMRRAVQA